MTRERKTGRSIALPEPPSAVRDAALALAAGAPEPARFGRVLAGTAGWTDPTLLKTEFYPRRARDPAGRLAYYATQFGLVEVDATYYTLLARETVGRWVTVTPADFCFDVKAHAALTGHPIDITKLPRELKAEYASLGARVYRDRAPLELVSALERRFVESLQPLRESGRLRTVLCQFPPWFGATRGNARSLEALRERFEDLPLSVEFRNSSWLAGERSERVFDLLARNRFSYVCVDEPHGAARGVPPVARVTNPELAVIRMHGQNREGWERGGATVLERFNYLYAPEELAAWLPSVRRLADEARSVHVVFNNCVRDYAVINAKGLIALLAAARE